MEPTKDDDGKKALYVRLSKWDYDFVKSQAARERRTMTAYIELLLEAAEKKFLARKPR